MERDSCLSDKNGSRENRLVIICKLLFKCIVERWKDHFQGDFCQRIFLAIQIFFLLFFLLL